MSHAGDRGMIPEEDMHISYNFICCITLHTPPVLDDRGQLIYLELLTVWLQRFDSLTIGVKGNGKSETQVTLAGPHFFQVDHIISLHP